MSMRIPFAAEHLAKGLDLTNEGLNLPFGTIIDGEAMRYIKKQGIETGESGYRKIVELDTSARVDSLFGGKSKLTKSLWAKSGTKIFHTLQVEGRKYDVGLTVDSGEQNFFLEGRNGDVFTFNQVNSPARIATAALLADCTSDAGVLNVGLGTIDKFTVSGTVYIRGSSVTYSGKSGGTLTGLSGIPAGGVVTGDLVTQTSTPSTFASMTGKCGMIIEGSMLVSGVKGAENIIYISAPSNEDNPEFLWDFEDNGADAKILDNPVTAMIRGTDLGFVFGESFILATPGFDLGTNILRMIDVSTDFGAYNQRCAANVGGRVVTLGNKRLIPSVAVSGGDELRAKVDENFDAPIRPWLERFDDTGQSLNAFLSYDPVKGFLTIGGKINGAMKVRHFDARDGIKAFTPEDIRPVGSYTYFDGKSYFGNNSSHKVYIDNQGFTNDGFPIVHRARTSRMEDKRNRRQVYLDYLKIDGFMSTGCEATLNVYVDGNFDIPAYSIVLDDSLITSTKGLPIGRRNPGSSLLGGDTTEIPTKKYPFKADIDLTGISGEDFSLEIVCTKLAAYLQWKSFTMEGDGVRFSSRDRL